jgi:hypothetical protein
VTPSRASLEAWCDTTLSLMQELDRRDDARADAVRLAEALDVSLSTIDGTDWPTLLERLEAWEASAQLPPHAPRPAALLRRILEVSPC